LKNLYIILLLTFGLGQDYSLQFYGSEYVTIPHSSSLNVGEALTIEAWVKIEGSHINDWPYIISKHHAHHSWDNGYELGYYESFSETYPSNYFGGLSVGNRIYSNTAPEMFTWFHLAFTWDGNNGYLWYNGNLISESELSFPGNSTENLTIGGKNGNYWNSNVNGKIDEVRISSNVRYDETFIPDADFENDEYTMALFNFNEGSGTTAYDLSSNGNHGTINGATWSTDVPCEACGCTNPDACNFDPDAEEDDGSCATFDECGICDGNGIADGTCDCDGNVNDCAGECGGSAVEDACGVCQGDNSSCSGCTDQYADNYDETANVDDGSCTYPDNGDYSLEFDGVDDWVDLGDILNDLYMPTTIQVSFNFDGEYSPLIQTDNADNGPDSYYSGYKFFANSTFLEIAYGDGTGAGSDDRRTAMASNLLLEEGIWYEMTAVFRGPTDMDIYLDGNELEVTYSGTGGNLSFSSNHFKIGTVQHFTYSPSYLTGGIDELKVWNTALSSEELSDNNDDYLVGYWNFNAGSGSILYDHSGNGNHGTINGATWVENIYGCTDQYADNYDETAYVDNGSCAGYPDNGDYSLEFDGEDDWIYIGQPIGMSPTNSHTIIFNIDYHTQNHMSHIIGEYNASPTYNNSLQYAFREGDMQDRMGMDYYGNSLYTEPFPQSGYTEWALSYDSESLERRIYRNGYLVASDIADGSYNGNFNIMIGAHQYSIHNFEADHFSGYIDELIILNKSIDHQEIETFSFELNNVIDQDLVALYKFNAGTGDILYDHSGNGNHGTINGGATWSTDVACSACGCTNPDACNYDPEAEEDDGSCASLDECGECGGSGIADGACDCDGNILDECGICGGEENNGDELCSCESNDDCIGLNEWCYSNGDEQSYCVVYDGDFCEENECFEGDGDCDPGDDECGDGTLCGVDNCEFNGEDQYMNTADCCYCSAGYYDECGVCGGDNSSCTITDIDGNLYGTIQLGDQLWMAENLKVTHYRNGDEIPTGLDNSAWISTGEGAYTIYDDEPSNADIYGNLYNWYAVETGNLAPDGWHVPSDEEYTILTDYLGGESVAGGKMKEEGNEHWHYYSDEVTEEATNESGFTGLPGGERHDDDGYYIFMGSAMTLWSSTENNSNNGNAWGRHVVWNNSEVILYNSGKKRGFSVRCVADEVTTGCTNPDACNYDPEAEEDDGSCANLDECGECGGSGIADGACDCDGNVLDECGICGGEENNGDELCSCESNDDCIGLNQWCYSNGDEQSYCVVYDGDFCEENECYEGDGDCDPGDDECGNGTVCGVDNCEFNGEDQYMNTADCCYCSAGYYDECGECGGDNSSCTIITDVDGNLYGTIQIGEQLWMAENLKVTHYQNGDVVDYYIYLDNSSISDIHGFLYKWDGIDDDRGICPENYHVPSNEEWTLLTDYLGGLDIAGGKMKATGTIQNGDGLWNLPNTGATNESGFNGFPSGVWHAFTNGYTYIDDKGFFWSSTECDDGYKKYRRLIYDDDSVLDNCGHPNTAMSLRCLADEIGTGCTNPDACNYDPEAEEDDGSCATLDECGICGGTGYVDNCGVCDDDPENDCPYDCFGVPGGDAVEDCAGECGGTSVIDECGICGGDGAVFGDAGCCEIDVDQCGICGGDGSIPEGVCDCEGNLYNCNLCPTLDPEDYGTGEVCDLNLGYGYDGESCSEFTGCGYNDDAELFFDTFDACDGSCQNCKTLDPNDYGTGGDDFGWGWTGNDCENIFGSGSPQDDAPWFYDSYEVCMTRCNYGGWSPWEDDPSAYELTASMTAVIFLDGSQFGDGGDVLAAFDDENNVRGVALQIVVPEGMESDYAGTILYEMQIRSNNEGDQITFQYYDASESSYYDICEGYTFLINDIIGDAIDPHILNCATLECWDGSLACSEEECPSIPNYPYDWVDCPPCYENTASMTAIVLDALSGDQMYEDGDILAAFDDAGNNRGVAILLYPIPFGPYEGTGLYEMQIRGDVGGDIISFKYYDASEDAIYDIAQSYSFIIDDILGNVMTPHELTAGAVSISIPIASGWNWFSLNVDGDSLHMTISNVMSSLTSTQDDFIKSIAGSATYYEGFGWFGGLVDMDVTGMYKFFSSNTDNLVFSGDPVDPLTTPIDLAAGWNWIGFTPQNDGPISDALASITTSDEDFIKNQGASSTYYSDFGWYGGLSVMAPTEGYMLSVAEESELIYPNFGSDDALIRSKELKVLPSIISEWVINPHAYEFNGTITLSIDNHADQPDDYIAVYVGDECRGITEYRDFPFDNVERGIYIMMVYSNIEKGEDLTFKYYDSLNDEIISYTENIEFTSDMIIGDGFKPFALSREVTPLPTEFSLDRAYPNPFNPVTKLSFAIPVDSEVSLSVYNLQGREVSTLISGYMDAGYHSVVWNANSHSSGVYFVKMVAGEYVNTQKLMLVK
jgi:uncharacterized protein (TIGR02145 family)